MKHNILFTVFIHQIWFPECCHNPEIFSGSWLGSSSDDWASMYDKNVLSGVRLVRSLVPGMKEAGWGSILNVTSGMNTGSPVGFSTYAAAKGGLGTEPFGEGG